jgi:hypothetical protein
VAIELFSEKLIADLEARYGGDDVFQRPDLYYLATGSWNESPRLALTDMASCLKPNAPALLVRKLLNPSSFGDTRSELEVASLLADFGYSPVYEPHFEGKTPDWMVFGPDGQPHFMVEVCTAHPPDDVAIGIDWLNELYHRLARLTAWHDLAVIYVNKPVHNLDHIAVVDSVSDWLSSLSPSGATRQTMTYEDGGSCLQIDCLPRTPATAGPVRVCVSGPMQWANERSLRRRISGKLTKYRSAGEAGIPLVVSVRGHEDSMFGVADLVSVLFGRTAYQVCRSGDRIVSTRWIRERDGLWSARDGTVRMRHANTALSAVLWLGHQGGRTAWLARNPWAANPLDAALFRTSGGTSWTVVEVEPPTDVLASMGD